MAWLCPAHHGAAIWGMVDSFAMAHLYEGPVVWHETFSQYQQRRLTKDYRFIFMCRKPGGQSTFNPDAIRIRSRRQELGDKRADPRGRVPGMVWRLRRLQGTSSDRVDWHPAQLPPELLERLVLGWSNPGDTVLDPFAGSGNCGLCCLRNDRRFVGVDRSQTYIDRMRRRLQQETE